jgi:hypothetical protein
MTGAKSGGSGRLLATLWAVASAWLLGSLVGLGACVGVSTFSGGMKNLLSLAAQFTAQGLSVVADALTRQPVIGVGVLAGGILGVILGRRRSS